MKHGVRLMESLSAQQISELQAVAAHHPLTNPDLPMKDKVRILGKPELIKQYRIGSKMASNLKSNGFTVDNHAMYRLVKEALDVARNNVRFIPKLTIEQALDNAMEYMVNHHQYHL